MRPLTPGEAAAVNARLDELVDQVRDLRERLDDVTATGARRRAGIRELGDRFITDVMADQWTGAL